MMYFISKSLGLLLINHNIHQKKKIQQNNE